MTKRFVAYRTRALAGGIAVAMLGFCSVAAPAAAVEPNWPDVGDTARDFELAALNGETVKLSNLTERGPVVLIVLRGFPGYQCPLCSRQVGEFLGASEKLRDAGASVAMVYPGPAEGLREHAEEFVTGKMLPKGFHLLIDPDYQFTNAYGLRWDAPRETAYPATFVIDRDKKVVFSKVSQSHAGRASAHEVLEAIEKMESPKAGEPDEHSTSAADILDRVRRHAFHPVEEGFTKDAELDHHGIADLGNDDWRVRTLAIRDLARIGSPAVPALLAGLEDEDLHVRHVAALVLGILPVGEAAGETLAVRRRGLEKRLQSDSNSIVRSEAAIALGRIGDRESAAVLEKAGEKDPSRDVRHQCALALDRVGVLGWDRSVFAAYEALDESTFERVAVGEPATDFTLRDTEGRPWKLSDFRGKKAVVLIWIFADWCPVCHGEFQQLTEMKQEFAESDVELVTIQCHGAYRSRVMVGNELLPQYWFAKQPPQQRYREGLWWSHLADPAGAVGARYGVQPLAFAVHSEYINRPSTIIIDKEGTVRFAYYGTFWGDRPSIPETLEMIRTGEFTFEHPERLQAAP